MEKKNRRKILAILLCVVFAIVTIALFLASFVYPISNWFILASFIISEMFLIGVFILGAQTDNMVE